jgi:hypothetical protein
MPDTARLVKLLDAAESNMFWSRIRNSIPGAKLEMHGISRLALPIASPLESGSAKNLNQSGVHISSRSLRIALRIQTNRDAPTICRQFAASAWGRKAPQTVDSLLQPALQNAADDG